MEPQIFTTQKIPSQSIISVWFISNSLFFSLLEGAPNRTWIQVFKELTSCNSIKVFMHTNQRNFIFDLICSMVDLSPSSHSVIFFISDENGNRKWTQPDLSEVERAIISNPNRSTLKINGDSFTTSTSNRRQFSQLKKNKKNLKGTWIRFTKHMQSFKTLCIDVEHHILGSWSQRIDFGFLELVNINQFSLAKLLSGFHLKVKKQMEWLLQNLPS